MILFIVSLHNCGTLTALLVELQVRAFSPDERSAGCAGICMTALNRINVDESNSEQFAGDD